MFAVILIVLPLIIGIIAWLLPKYAKYIAISGAVLQLALTIFLTLLMQIEKFQPSKQTRYVKEYPVMASFLEVIDIEETGDVINPEIITYQVKSTSLDVPWIESLGIDFSVKIDGIALLMLLLTNMLLPLIILSSFHQKIDKSGLFYALILFMQAAMVGVFVAADAFLYYVCWEAALIPIYFILLLWGGKGSSKVTFKFFVYTLVGSLAMLFSIITLYLYTTERSFSIESFYALKLTPEYQMVVFAGFMLAYAIKIPIFPLHTWQPDTYSVAPNPGTMLLAGVMLKMALYSILRWVIPVVPNAFADPVYSQWIIGITVVGMLYASCIALIQKDLKKLFAYSSIAHVGLIAAGIFTFTISGIQGAMLQMLSHGVIAVGLFMAAEVIHTRWNTYDLNLMGGIRLKAPIFATYFLIIVLGSIALPLTSNFVGEFMLLRALFKDTAWIGVLATIPVVLGAAYMLKMYQKACLGEATKEFEDVKGTQDTVLLIIAILVVVIGVAPQFFLNICEEDVKKLLEFASVKMAS